MSSIRNSIFEKYKTAASRYSHCAKGINSDVWPDLVQAWLNPEWQKVSVRNKNNRDQSTIVHTAGSVPIAKWSKEEHYQNMHFSRRKIFVGLLKKFVG
ncbi:hypothetical protein ACLB2K_003877 [Fragaria x ananassa]